MKRRHFLAAAGASGLAIMAPKAIKTLRADAAKYGGPYWLFVHAAGGWDPTYMCDPKGGSGDPKDHMSVNEAYTPDQIGSSGNIQWAPVNYTEQDNKKNTVEVYSNKRFFDTYKDRLLVINGLDTQTNNHDSGTRTTWSGQLGEGFPSLAALIAGVASQSTPVPMAFLSNGGYDDTEGLVPLTRAGSVGAMQRLAYPDRIDPTKPDKTYVTPDTSTRIAQAQSDRLSAAMMAAKLPVIHRSMSSLYLARQSNTGLDALADALTSQTILDLGKGTDPNFTDLQPIAGALGDLQNLMQQAQLALLAFASGVAISANLQIGGFDTHGDHDNRHIPQLMKLLRGLDYVYKTADSLGIGNNLYVLVGSDFGRTPFYNAGNGKDHWNITSMLLSGPNIQGNRVVGGTDGGFKQVLADPGTLTADANGGSVAIRTAGVHLALRQLAGVDQTPQAQQFGLPGSALPLFGLRRSTRTVRRNVAILPEFLLAEFPLLLPACCVVRTGRAVTRRSAHDRSLRDSAVGARSGLSRPSLASYSSDV